jgi:thymidine phosphorylase
MKVQAIITEGDQPIGNGIGPNLEARDILYILKRHPGAPRDLEEKSIMMADKLLKMSKNKSSAREILESGKAYSKMKEIIREQGGKSTIAPEEILIGKYSLDIKSTKSGRIIEINNKKITKVARVAGAPSEKTAGIYIYKKLKDKIKKNETIFTIYSNSKDKLDYAKTFTKGILKVK